MSPPSIRLRVTPAPKVKMQAGARDALTMRALPVFGTAALAQDAAARAAASATAAEGTAAGVAAAMAGAIRADLPQSYPAPARAQARANIGLPAAALVGHLLRFTGTDGSVGQASAIKDDGSGRVEVVGRQVITTTPTYDLAGGLLATALSIPLDGAAQTVPAGKTFSAVRLGQLGGSDITFTVGAGSHASGFYTSVRSGAASDANSNTYAGVWHVTVAGPGTGKAVHIGAYGATGSTGILIGSNVDLQPAPTQGYTAGHFTALNSANAHGVAIGYGIESAGDRYGIGFGNSVSAVGVTGAWVQWWRSDSTPGSARFLRLLNEAAAEIFFVDKDGHLIGPTVSATGELRTHAGVVRFSADLTKYIWWTGAKWTTSQGDLVLLDGAGKLPAIDGSQLTGLSAIEDASFGTAGYVKFRGGLIVQWGQATPSSGTSTITFPIPFPNNLFSISAMQVHAALGTNATNTVSVRTSSLSGCTLNHRFTTGASTIAAAEGCFWIAIGR
ncbi:hypothetical protein GJ689_25030 [Rhodoplanes serenus]|uniref:Putative tail fiber protein gp53-like C-terminal domain-containing protein n=1 Tax=Rhodoplanes serenus TaxID=200615 RepID=A0A9X5AVC4_9BRAD|nr:hypothetical protein [Rhodoplanes serenus]MTW19459.1 hypothetical protein [Rhodoplanes serenus]